MDQSRINAIRARCEAAEDNYKSVRANSELMELFHVDIPDLLAEVERLTRELEAAKRDLTFVMTAIDDAVACPVCDHFNTVAGCQEDECLVNDCEFKWRGPCAENGGVE